MSSAYWKDRQARAQAKMAKESTEKIGARLAKYYQDTSARVISSFIDTYNKIMIGGGKGIEPTPADLYRLESYWQMQGQLKKELEKLGYEQLAYLNKSFIRQYINAYEMVMDIKDDGAFSNVDAKAAQQVINQIWAADGSSWSDRVWRNVNELQEALNEELVHCVVTGKKSDDVKQILMERFNVSYNRADTLVKTELAHIQTQAARQRYEDMGVKRVQVWADEDERRCDICGKLHETYYSIYEQIPIPAHPRCRCSIIPVIED